MCVGGGAWTCKPVSDFSQLVKKKKKKKKRQEERERERESERERVLCVLGGL